MNFAPDGSGIVIGAWEFSDIQNASAPMLEQGGAERMVPLYAAEDIARSLLLDASFGYPFGELLVEVPSRMDAAAVYARRV